MFHKNYCFPKIASELFFLEDSKSHQVIIHSRINLCILNEQFLPWVFSNKHSTLHIQVKGSTTDLDPISDIHLKTQMPSSQR